MANNNDLSDNDLKNIITERLTESGDEIKAYIGRTDGQIRSLEPNASPNDIYVRLMNGQVITVYNEKVPRIPFRKVILGYEPGSPNRLQAIRLDDVYKRRPFPNLPNHKDSHSAWSYDAVEILKEQLMELLPRVVSGFNIRIYPGWFLCNGSFHALSVKDLDLTAEAVTSGAEWVNVETDEAGTITYQHSANYGSRELLIPEDIPATSIEKKLLCSVKMYAGQVRIIQNKTKTDIFDPRFSGVASGGGATSILWEDILSLPSWVELIDNGELLEFIEIFRWSGVEGQDTFEYPDIVEDIVSVEINGLGQDPFYYSLSDSETQLLLSVALPADAIVTSRYKIKVTT